MIVRDKVLFIDKLNKFTNSNFLYLRKFSRTRSKITTVSLIEYPAIVNIAAIVERLNSTFYNDKTPRVNSTS